MCGKWQDLSIWLKEIKIVSEPYHGGQLKGPECQKILKNILSLQQFSEKHAVFEAIEVINCLRKFNSAVECCFGNDLRQNY